MSKIAKNPVAPPFQEKNVKKLCSFPTFPKLVIFFQRELWMLAESFLPDIATTSADVHHPDSLPVPFLIVSPTLFVLYPSGRRPTVK